MFVVLKTTTVAAEAKAEALWELLWPKLLRIHTDVSTGQTSPGFYVTLTLTVRDVYHALCWHSHRQSVCVETNRSVRERPTQLMGVREQVVDAGKLSDMQNLAARDFANFSTVCLLVSSVLLPATRKWISERHVKGCVDS